MFKEKLIESNWEDALFKLPCNDSYKVLKTRENFAFVCVMSRPYYHPWFRKGFDGCVYSLASSHFLHASSLSFTQCSSPLLTVKNWLAELLCDCSADIPVFRLDFLSSVPSHWELNIRTQSHCLECTTLFARMAPSGNLPYLIIRHLVLAAILLWCAFSLLHSN